MDKMYSICGDITTPEDVSELDVMNAIVDLAESKGWVFGGTVKPYDEDEQE